MRGKKKGKDDKGMRMPGPMGKMMGKMMGASEEVEDETVEVSQTEEKETPLEVLKRRFANSEITKEEYLDMKELLSD